MFGLKTYGTYGSLSLVAHRLNHPTTCSLATAFPLDFTPTSTCGKPKHEIFEGELREGVYLMLFVATDSPNIAVHSYAHGAEVSMCSR